jgi:uncharacterized protein DUF642/putative Ig domain-containing protein
VGGTLPTGLSLSSSGVISGTAPAQDKPANFTVKAVNGTKTSEATFTIWALDAPIPPLLITTPASPVSPPNATVAEPYASSLLASGGTGKYTWSLVKGSLPTGLSLMSNGFITGTPPVQDEPASFTAEVTSGPLTQKKTFTLWALGTVPSSKNLVRDGGFETPVISSGYVTFEGGHVMGPWHVLANSVDLVSGSFLPAHGGNQEVDLSGTNYNGDSAGGIFEDVPTTPGQVYTLTYAESGNNQGAPAVKTLTVTFGGQFVGQTTFDTTGSDTYVVHSYDVEATSTTSRIEFTSQTTSLFGPLIDDVSLTVSNASVGG